jgi:hypothetical protein
MPSPRLKARLFWLGLLFGAMALLALPQRRGGVILAPQLLAGGLLVGALTIWLRRQGARPLEVAKPRLTVEGRAALSNRCDVALVLVDGAPFLVAFGEGFASIRRAPLERVMGGAA